MKTRLSILILVLSLLPTCAPASTLFGEDSHEVGKTMNPCIGTDCDSDSDKKKHTDEKKADEKKADEKKADEKKADEKDKEKEND